MAEYRKWEDISNTWITRRLAGRKCQACGKPIAGMKDAYVCLISHRTSDYRVYCAECYEQRMDKKAGNTADTKANPYEIKHIIKACKALKMKVLVEEQGSDLAKRLTALGKDIDEEDYDSRYSTRTPLAALIQNFPQALSLMAAGKLRGGGKDPGRVDKHRLELFVELARRLRPFLPKATGTGLNRLYEANRHTMADKHAKRSKHKEWLSVIAKKPARLFPMTGTDLKSARLLQSVLPSGSCELARKYTGSSEQAAKQRLGIGNGSYAHDLDIEVYNTPHGPRFIIKHTTEEKE
jgi:hypothetical protein